MTEHTVTLAAGDSLRLIVSTDNPAFAVNVELRAEQGSPPSPTPPAPLEIIDLTATLPTNDNPTNPRAWWIRRLDQINGITIHHTGVDTPQVAAQIHVNRGRPTIEYHLWVSYEGEVFQCLDPTVGCWHDHTGHYNRHLSIALAGYHHTNPPSEDQLRGLVRAVAWAMNEYDVSIEDVRGHDDWAMAAARVVTICPGWDESNWRDTFYERLRLELV